MNKRAKLFIISAPSGSGKTTLCQRLLNMNLGLDRSVSMTTRPKRPGEKHGRDYYFVSKNEFERRIRQKKFLEWTKTYGWYYGTPKRFVERAVREGKSLLFNVDVKGAMNIRRFYPERAVLVFVLPPSLKELKARLKKRNADNKKEVDKRMKIVKREFSYAHRYDYCVLNDKIENALGKLKFILMAERCKTK